MTKALQHEMLKSLFFGVRVSSDYCGFGAGEVLDLLAGFSFFTTSAKNPRKYSHIDKNAEITTTQSMARPAV